MFTLKMPLSIMRPVKRALLLQNCHFKSKTFAPITSNGDFNNSRSGSRQFSSLCGSKGRRLNSAISETTSNGTAMRHQFHTSTLLFSNGISNPVVYVDASGTHSCAGYWEHSGRWFRYGWDQSLINADPGITWMEYFPIIIAVIQWGDCWENKLVEFRSDNSGVCSNLAFTGMLHTLQSTLNSIAIQYRFTYHMTQIRSEHNLVDPLTRGDFDKFWALNPTVPEGLGTFEKSLNEKLNLVRRNCGLPIKE